MGLHRHSDILEKRHDLRGQPYYWSGLVPEMSRHSKLANAEDELTDVHELADGYITITPLNFDMTDRAQVTDPYIQQIIESLD